MAMSRAEPQSHSVASVVHVFGRMSRAGAARAVMKATCSIFLIQRRITQVLWYFSSSFVLLTLDFSERLLGDFLPGRRLRVHRSLEFR